MGMKASLGAGDHLPVASNGLFDYYVAARDYGHIRGVAEKCVATGFVSKILRPAHLLHLRSLVTEVETPTLYELEDAGSNGIWSAERFRGTTLAQEILNNVSTSGE